MTASTVILIILVLLIVLFSLYLITIIASVLEDLAASDDSFAYITTLGDSIKEYAATPIQSFTHLIEINSTVLYVLALITAALAVYVLLKTLFSKGDNNPKDSDYKIAKHGSHGSARWSTKKELFNDGTFVGLNEDKAYRIVLSSLKKKNEESGEE